MIKTFEYYNPNPLNKETGDCVIRALCKATDRSWVSVYDELCNYGRDFGVLPNSSECWEDFLDNNGFIRQKVTVNKSKKPITVTKFCEKYKKGIYILSVVRHLVCVEDGKFYDLNYFARNYKVDACWRKVDKHVNPYYT